MQEKNFNHIILEPNLCYGCGACVATCPKKCLKFEKDVLGFRRVLLAVVIRKPIMFLDVFMDK